MEDENNDNYNSSKSITNHLNEFQIRLSVPNYDIKTFGKTEDIIFTIVLFSKLTNKEWTISRKYSDLLELNALLSVYYLKVPFFPKRNGSDQNLRELELRKNVIEKYLNELIRRPDFINSIHVKNMLQIDNHYPDFHLFQPLMLFELFDFPMNITNFAYSKRHNLLFVGLGEKSLSSKISTILNFTLPWEKKKQEKFLGGISINHMIKNFRGEIHVEQIKFIGYQSYVSCTNFCEINSILCVGLGNGTIYLYKINISDNKGKKCDFIEEISCIRAHKTSIINIGVQYSTGYIFSCAKERVLVISEMNYQSVMKVFEVSSKEISCMQYDNDSQRVYITDISGSLWIISVKTIPPIVLQASHNILKSISAMELNLDKNFIFLGNSEGRVIFYDFNDEEINNITLNKRLDIQTEQKLRVTKINYNINKNFLIISFSNGSTAIYAHDEEYPEFLLEGHMKEVNNTYWDDDNKILITSGNDKRFKIWQLPVFYPSEMMRKNKVKNQKTLITDNSVNLTNLLKIKQGFSEGFNFEDNQPNNEINEEETTFNNEEKNKNKIENQFIEKLQNDLDENDENFDNISNVFSKNDHTVTKHIERKYKIEKDDLLGWDI